jgi:hypothetical protein
MEPELLGARCWEVGISLYNYCPLLIVKGNGSWGHNDCIAYSILPGHGDGLHDEWGAFPGIERDVSWRTEGEEIPTGGKGQRSCRYIALKPLQTLLLHMLRLC